MLPNFLQKPTGTAAVLIAAIGGPYAAFETNLGTAARKVLMGVSGNGSPDGNSPSGQDPNWQSQMANSAPTLNYMTNGQGVAYPQSAYPQSAVQSQGPIPIGSGNPVPSSSIANASQMGGAYSDPQYIPNAIPQSAPQVMGAPSGYPVSAYAAPAYPAINSPMASYPGQPVLESRQGPAGVVPGTTHQLWDYTLGVPQLQQLQQQPGAIGGGKFTICERSSVSIFSRVGCHSDSRGYPPFYRTFRWMVFGSRSSRELAPRIWLVRSLITLMPPNRSGESISMD